MTRDSTFPLVSILVISHNYGRFLAEAIESALAQTYTPTEIILVDDGSTDDSLDVARRYESSIRILSQGNVGVERTANRAVHEAAGSHFVFLSADDVFEPTYVEELYRALRQSPEAAYAYCRARMFGAQTGLMKGFPFSPYILVRRGNYVNGSALMAKTDYLAASGFNEDLADYGLEDWDFWLTMLERGKRGTYVRAPLLRWRRHAEGSRNPESKEKLKRSVEVVRARHRALYEQTSDWRGRLGYSIELAVAVAELVFGFSRSQGFLREVERRSWRRFKRWHASPDDVGT